MVDLTLIAALVALLLYLFYRRFLALPYTDLPGPKQKWFLGNLGVLREARKQNRGHLIIGELAETYGPLVGLNFPGRLYIVTTDLKLAKVLFDMKDAIAGAGFADALGSMIGKGLLFLTGDTWQRHRQFAVKAFTNNSLNNVVLATNNHVSKIIQSWKSSLKSESVDVGAFAIGMTTTVLSTVVLGSDRLAEVEVLITSIMRRAEQRLAIPKIAWPWLFKDQKQYDNEAKQLRAALAGLVEKRKASLAANGNQSSESATTLLDAMLAESKNDVFSEQEILDEAVTFYVAGYETSSNTVAFALHEMAAHPEVVQRMFEEVVSICGDNHDIDWEQVNQLDYIEMVIKETLRLHSPAPATSRRLAQPLTYEGRTFPAGTAFIVPFSFFHKSEEFWEKPLEFNPDRFRQTPVPGSYMPFGMGRRTCIGNRFAMIEMKIALARLVRHFTFARDDSKPIVVQYGITFGFNPSNGVHVFVKNR